MMEAFLQSRFVRCCIYVQLAMLVIGGLAMAAVACLDSRWGAEPFKSALNAIAGIAIAAMVVGGCAYIGAAVASVNKRT